MKLGSNTAFTAFGVLVPAIAIVQDMPPGTSKTVVLSILLIVTGLIGWRAEGSGISPEEGKSLKDLLDEGRK